VGLRSEWVELTAGDGTTLRAWISRPDGQSPRRGLLVFQEAFGVNAHIRHVTQRFAAAGYVAIAPELFHRTAPGFDCRYDEFAATMPHLKAITEQGLETDARAAFDWLAREGVADNAAAVGYCLGGRAAFVANSAVPLRAAVSYYGGNIPPLIGRAPRLSGPMLFFWGGLDHHIPDEQRRAVITGVREANKVFVDVTFSGADHGFFCDARAAYQPQAALQAWHMTLAFLDTYCLP
jgi:carboxymethylenebutenolidase